MSASGKYYSSIPDPTLDQKSQLETLMAVKHNSEVLTQQRKPSSASAVTWADLLALGLITSDQMPR